MGCTLMNVGIGSKLNQNYFTISSFILECMTEHGLSEGDVVYDYKLEEKREVVEVKDGGTVVWDKYNSETPKSVAANLERGKDGGYVVQ